MLPGLAGIAGFAGVAGPTFPVVSATNTSASVGTSHTVSLPSGIVSGDLLIAAILVPANRTITGPSGWTLFVTHDQGTSTKIRAYYRVADGSEGASIDITHDSSSTSTSHVTYRITNYQGIPEAVVGSGSSAAPRSGSLSPSWGAADTLWLSVEGHRLASPLISYPANYSDGLTIQSGATGGGNTSNISSAQRELNSSSEHPEAFEITHSRTWCASTIAVRPA